MTYNKLMPLLLTSLLLAPAALALTPGEAAFLDHLGTPYEVVPLWPGGQGPDESQTELEENFIQPEGKARRIQNVLEPSMIIIPPPEGVARTGVTWLSCPGGGYGGLATDNTEMLAEWCHAMGATVVMLKYRVPKRPGDDDRLLPLQDAQRAMGILRARAAEWGMDPDKIGVIGTSAGGHLVFNLAHRVRERAYTPIDAYDEIGCTPNAVLALYPAYLTKPSLSLDANPNLDYAAINKASTPPMFFSVTAVDKFTHGSVKAMLALKDAGVPVELHIYPTGGHGGGFDKYPLMEFGRHAARFFADQGFFTPAMRKASDAWLDAKRPGVQEQFFPGSAAPPKPPLPALPAFQGLHPSQFSLGEQAVADLSKGGQVLPLWPGGIREDDPLAPGPEELGEKNDGILRISKVTRPSMTIFRPEKRNGRAILIFPGGGYGILAAGHEGSDVARWLNEQGITAFLIKYRVPRREGLDKHAVALEDAQRAIRFVRARAEDFGIDPEHIGVLGFSAGGHLAALSCSQFDTPAYAPVDDHDQASARPDFGVLIYPAYGTVDRNTAELDMMLQGKNSPPLYIAFAADDPYMPSAMHYMLQRIMDKVSIECHVYTDGGHGGGILPRDNAFAQWPKSATRWLQDFDNATKQ